MRFSLSVKLYLLMVPTLAVGFIVGGLAWHALKGGTAELQAANELENQALLSKYYISEMGDAMKSYILNPTNEKEVIRKKKADENNIAAMERMKTLTTDQDLLSLIQTSADFDGKTLDPSENQVLEYIKSGNHQEARNYFLKTYLPYRDESNAISEKVFAAATAHAREHMHAVTKQMQLGLNAIILSLGLSVLLLMAWIGILAKSISKNLRQVTSGISSTGSSIAQSTTKLSAAGQDVSGGASSTASSLEEIVASVEELTSMVKLNADNAKNAADISQKSSQTAEVGEQELKQLIQAMADISVSSKRIADIINVIDDISFQTNLLALNAAVEAARAGEHGRSFAVVAEAVRNLALRSSTAAKDITSLIKESVQKTENGVLAADRSQVVLTNVLSSINQVSELNNRIAIASDEQAKGIAQISQAMQQLDQATQTNANAAEEVARGSQGFADQALELQVMVSHLESLIEGKKNISPTLRAG